MVTEKNTNFPDRNLGTSVFHSVEFTKGLPLEEGNPMKTVRVRTRGARDGKVFVEMFLCSTNLAHATPGLYLASKGTDDGSVAGTENPNLFKGCLEDRCRRSLPKL